MEGKEEGSQDVKEGEVRRKEGDEKKKIHVRRGVEGAQRRRRVLSCSLNQNWVRHSCILGRPFQVQSVTQYEAVVAVSMATRPTERAGNQLLLCW